MNRWEFCQNLKNLTSETFWAFRAFFQKLGSIIFLAIGMSNFMQKINKIDETFLKILRYEWKDEWTDKGTNKTNSMATFA